MDNESTIKSSDPCYGSEADNKKKRRKKRLENQVTKNSTKSKHYDPIIKQIYSNQNYSYM